jgi:hypothetical protein
LYLNEVLVGGKWWQGAGLPEEDGQNVMKQSEIVIRVLPTVRVFGDHLDAICPMTT